MNRNQIMDIQSRVGTEPDGWWGPKSIKACKQYLRSLAPKDNPFPKPDFKSMVAYYGHPGDTSKLVNIPVRGLGVEYDGQSVKSIRCHEKVADSLLKILHEISISPHASILKDYAGVYNFRNMRGGNSWSKHAWGVAIDLSPQKNGLWTHWPTKATMPLDVMEIFAQQGWTAAGAFWGRDAMHMEATS